MRIVCLIVGLALSSASFALVSPEAGYEPLAPLPIHATTTRSIVEELAGRHYVTANLDDALSSRIFDAYLDNMDASKSYLLATDIQEFGLSIQNGRISQKRRLETGILHVEPIPRATDPSPGKSHCEP